MDAFSARAETGSWWRAARTLALSFAIVAACAIAGPAAAFAEENVDRVALRAISFFTTDKMIELNVSRPSGVSSRVAITESEEHRSITIRDNSSPSEFTATAPCEKTEAATAVCPSEDGMGHLVSLILARGPFESNANVTVDTPTLLVIALTGEGNDTISVAHSTRDDFQTTTAILDGGPGNDTLTGDASLNEIYGEQGTDTIFAFNEPAAEDHVYCGGREIESPVDIAHVDSADTISGECGRVIRGP